MPYPAATVAYAFVQKGIEEGIYVTQMQLQKMVYFAHGHHLVAYDKPLIKEEFQAWEFGPVVPSIYKVYRLYGADPIFDVGLIDKVPSDYQQLLKDEDAMDSINYTWLATRNVSAYALSAWTHQPGSPWEAAYRKYDRSGRIPNPAIKKFFEKVLLTEPNEQTEKQAS